MTASESLSRAQDALTRNVAYIIPRVAARLPWRADCLIQALAAQRWLGRHGVASYITIGTGLDKDAQFRAHAWLNVGDLVITGGEISAYTPLLSPERQD